VPQALQRYDIFAKISAGQLTVTNLLILVLVLLGFKLKAVFLASTVSLAIFAFCYYVYDKKLLPEVTLGFNFVIKEINRIYSFGLLVASTNLASSILLQLDRLIIPAFLGPSALTYYSLPGNVASKIPGVTTGFGGMMIPLACSLSGQEDRATIKTVYIRAFRNLTLVSAAIACGISLFAYKIMYFWLGQDFAAKSTNILVILTATYFLLGIFTPLTQFLLGLGKVKFLAIFSGGLALLNMLLLFLLVPRFGITGAAWAYLGSTVPVVWAFYWTEKKILELENRAADYFKLYAKLILTAVIFFIIIKFTLLKATASLAGLIVLGPVSVGFYLLLYKLLGFMEKEDWDLFASYIKKIKSRLWGGAFGAKQA
jgi:O-antigen/teichoic acid export membrane protein